MKDAIIERFIEELAMMLELEAATPRMVGRVLGWLLVCDPPEQSAADLAKALQASKGSISTSTRVLLRMGFIERVRTRGERFDRFRVQPDAWDELFWRVEQFSEPRRILKIGLEGLSDESPEARKRLEELDWRYAWWEQRLPKLHEEFLADVRRAREQQKKGGRK